MNRLFGNQVFLKKILILLMAFKIFLFQLYVKGRISPTFCESIFGQSISLRRDAKLHHKNLKT